MCETGDDVRIADCEVWHVFGDTKDQNTKNDHIFHNAALKHILRNYLSRNSKITHVRIWTDNCPTQYRCRQTQYATSKLPNEFENLEEIEHCFAQLYSFKGPWDTAGRIIKYYFSRMDKSEAMRFATALACFIGAALYFLKQSPSGIDWSREEEKGSMRLLEKTVFTTTKRISCYATDKKDEYDSLNEKYDHVIYTNRDGAQDTSAYDEMKTGSVFCSKGEDKAGATKLTMYPEKCLCTKCRAGETRSCRYKHISGEPKDFWKKSKDVMTAEKEEKEKKLLVAHLQVALNCVENKWINEAYTNPSNKKLTDAELKSLLIAMGVKLNGGSGKNGSVVKKDRSEAMKTVTRSNVLSNIEKICIEQSVTV